VPEISLADSSRAPWKLSWKWSRPASISEASLGSSRGRPEVMRLT
jgi:hypothetical protein